MAYEIVAEGTGFLDQGTRHRKDRVLHQHGPDDSAQVVVVIGRKVPGVQPYVACRVIERGKERQALDMIHVGMGEEELGIEKIALLHHDFLAQRADAGSCVYYNSLGTTGQLEASGVSAILDGLLAWAGNTSPGAPKLELE